MEDIGCYESFTSFNFLTRRKMIDQKGNTTNGNSVVEILKTSIEGNFTERIYVVQY